MIAALALVLAPAVPAPARAEGAGGAGGAGERRVRAVLTHRGDAETRKREQVLAGLVQLGPDAAEALFGLLLEGGPERLVAGAEGEHPRLWGPPDRVPELALDALARLSGEAVAELLAAHASQDTPHDERLQALRVIAANGHAACLPVLLELSETFAEVLRYRSVHAGLEQAFAAVWRAPGIDWHAAVFELRDLGAERLTIAVDGLVRARRGEGLELLADVLSDEPQRDLALVDGLVRLAEAVPWSDTDGVRRALTRAANGADVAVRRTAVRGLGRVGGADAAGDLIALLQDDREGVAEAAAWALARIGGPDVPTEPAAVEAWWTRENERWDERRETLAASLEETDAAALAAVRELAHETLFRHRAAELLAGLLAERPELAAVAGYGLVDLGSLRVAPRLVDALDAPEQSVRTAAYRALVGLSGQHLPARRDAWAGWLDGGARP